MKFVLWGLGIKGKRVFKFLGKSKIAAIIESDESKTGMTYENVPIVHLEEYMKNYRNYFIIISPNNYEMIVEELKSYGIYEFFILRECPTEFQGKPIEDFWNKIPIPRDTNKSLAIYGINLYSLLLYEKLTAKGYSRVWMIPDSRCDPRKVEALVSQVNIADLKEIENLSVKGNIFKCWDFSAVFSEYHNDKLEGLKGLHKGKRGFIIATGPSLRVSDLETLYEHNEICISMNRIFKVFEDVKWRPQYYMIEDLKLLEGSKKEIFDLDIENKLITDDWEVTDSKEREKGVLRYHRTFEPLIEDRPEFSLDISRKVVFGYTITYGCIQLAAYLGLKEIYLLGVDFNYNSSNSNSQNHFVKNYLSKTEVKSKNMNGFFQKESLLAYEAAEEASRQNGFRIYNATRGGKLEVFERVNFDKLF